MGLDQQPPGHVGAGQGDLLGVPQHPHGLAPVHRRALHLRLLFKGGQLGLVGRIDGVAAHVVQPLGRFLGGFVVAPGPLVVGVGEPPGPGVLVDPAVGAAQVEHLPGFQFDGLSRVHPANLDALPKPADNPVCPGSIEHIGKILCPLALQVVQVPLAGQNLILAALLPQPPPGHLLGVDADGVM